MTRKPHRRPTPPRELVGPDPIRELARNPVHERGLTLTRGEWSTVLHLPAVCDTFGEPCPDWAWALWRHALMVESMAPTPLLGALLHALEHRSAAPCDLLVGVRGVELDLCIIVPTTGDTAEIVPTPFGCGVALLHRLHVLDGEHEPTQPRGYDA